MALNSINTNIAAYFAQSNIGRASDSASSSISRLSSGNRIVRASDDVAGLSIGTTLRSQVSTLRQALTNSAQGGSLLQVADGALSQVSEILQRQKSIATQANSGTLTDTERAYLNQEFQSLTQQIDQISNSTRFGSVKLLDGSVSSTKDISTNIQDSSSSANSTAAILTVTGNYSDGDEVTIGGVSVKLTTSAVGTTGAVGKVTIGSSAANTLLNIAAFLNSNTDSRLAGFTFSTTATTLTASYNGGYSAGNLTITSAEVTDGGTVNTSANGTITANTGVTADGLSLDRTRVLGTVTGNLLVNSNTTAQSAGQALDLNAIRNNKDFIGVFGQGAVGNFTATYAGATDTITFSIRVGDIVYSTAATDITNTNAVTTLTFNGAKVSDGSSAGGAFTVKLNGNAYAASSITGQTDADTVAAQLNAGVSGVTITQNRDVTSFQNGGIISLGGVQVANLSGASVRLRSDDFSNPSIESIKIIAPTAGTSDARIEVVINGETFISRSGLGSTINVNTITALQSTTDSTKVLTFVTGATAIASGNSVAIDLASQDKADAVAAALETAFGLGSAGSKLSFQVGSLASDTIGISLASVASTRLYNGATLSVETIPGAQAASDALDAALGNINSVRATVGALQSRVNFISANLESAVQNQDAARGLLLDTDIASEATSYATSQVKLQAGISVLAQANQLPQSLLKLLG